MAFFSSPLKVKIRGYEVGEQLWEIGRPRPLLVKVGYPTATIMLSASFNFHRRMGESTPSPMLYCGCLVCLAVTWTLFLSQKAVRHFPAGGEKNRMEQKMGINGLSDEVVCCLNAGYLWRIIPPGEGKFLPMKKIYFLFFKSFHYCVDLLNFIFFHLILQGKQHIYSPERKHKNHHTHVLFHG